MGLLSPECTSRSQFFLWYWTAHPVIRRARRCPVTTIEWWTGTLAALEKRGGSSLARSQAKMQVFDEGDSSLPGRRADGLVSYATIQDTEVQACSAPLPDEEERQQ